MKKGNNRVVAIIQARMGSTRLPGKVMKNIGGKPMLMHCVSRLKKCKLVNCIVVATTVNEEDNIIEGFCGNNGLDVFRGDGEDVLSRYYEASIRFNADIVVRVTSDCPFIDPGVVDEAVSKFLEMDVDYVSNTGERTYPRGMDVEVFSREALRIAASEATEEFQREHVTPFIWEKGDLFKTAQIKNDADFSDMRITVDTVEDMELAGRLYKEVFNKKNDSYTFRDLVAILSENPELRKINAHIKQKHVK